MDFDKWSENLSALDRPIAKFDRLQCRSRNAELRIMPLPKPEKLEDRRQSPRHQFARLARIQPVDDGPWHYCLVTDMSDGGVRLHAPGFAVTEEFLLSISSDHPARDGTYQVIWRLRDDVGARLVESAQRTYQERESMGRDLGEV
jgi:hypothetical protein